MVAQPLFTKDEIKARVAQMRGAGVDLPPFNLALLIAASALAGQRDKSGAAYLHHPVRVAMNHTEAEAKKIIGVLHDVVEDSDWTLDDLRDMGFEERVVQGVDGVTCRKGELYFDFIVRCSQNPDSIDVKINDLQDNQNQSRNNFLLSGKDHERLNKYILSYNYLVAIKKEHIAPGTPFADWMRAQRPELQDQALLAKYSRTASPPAPAPHHP